MCGKEFVFQAADGRRDRFFFGWLLSYFLGSFLGLTFAEIVCNLQAEQLLFYSRQISNNVFSSIGKRFFGTAIFLAVIILVSQFSIRHLLLDVLVVCKAFCTAFVLGLFYLMNQISGNSALIYVIVLHTILIMPPFYFLSSYGCHTDWGHTSHRCFFDRILPVLLAFFYLLPAYYLEVLLLQAII